MRWWRSPSWRSGLGFVARHGIAPVTNVLTLESQCNRGYATAAVEALVTKAREARDVRRIVAHTPLERPQSGRVLESTGFAMAREMDDADEAGNVVRVKEWELAV